MDKYAVDLDQVLNDFEYNELTDQYNNASRNAATASSLPQINVTKHSINNVLHSLNEYLNTNINVDPIHPIDNNALSEDKENYLSDANVVKVTQSNYKDEEKSIDRNFKTDFLLDFNGVTGERNNVVEREIEVSHEENRVVDYKDIALIGEKAHVSEVIDENVGNVCEVEENAESTDKAELYVKESDAEYIPQETCTSPENEIIKVEDIVETEPESGDACDSSSKIDVIKEKVIEQIGFDDDIELDDNEVMKLLEELEDEEKKELESQTAEDLSKVVECEIEKESNKSEAESRHVEETISAPASDDPNEIIDVEINTESFDEDNAVVTVEIIDDDEESVKLTVEDGILSEEPSLLDTKEDAIAKAIKENVDIPMKEETAVEGVDEKVDMQQSGGNVEEENVEIELEKESSVESLSRPQNLPLGEADQPKRKIDLIGDPGSTPYNNVYINKEIPKTKDKTYDSDTDYSTSSSPTFSDASSTTSTVSVEDVRNDGNHLYTNPKIVDDQEHTEFTNVDQVSRTVTEATLEETENSHRYNQHPTTDAVSRTSDDRHTNPDSELPASDFKETAPYFQDPAPDFQHPAPDLQHPAPDIQDAARDIQNPAPDETSMKEETSSGLCEVPTGTDEAAAGASAPRVENLGEVNVGSINMDKQWLGKEAPLWVPDSDAMSCLHCDMKFTVLKRRHHCRACGLVLCSKCCHLRFRLEYLDAEARVCNKCHDILNKDTNSTSSSEMSPEVGNSPSHRPNPNNPLEYCSTVSPLQQVAGSNPNPPAVMVPVGVLKRKGSNKAKSNKSVMFCDGIRPGSDLTNLDNDFNYNNTKSKTKPDKANPVPSKPKRNLPVVDPDTNTFIPSNENCLPPTVTMCKTDVAYSDCPNGPTTVETLKSELLTFVLQVNLYVHVRIIEMSCCINKTAWCFSTEGLINVGQDEIVILLEYIDEESFVPKDVFFHINNVYNDAVKGTSVKELGLSLHNTSNFLDSKNHAGFVYIRPTFQCLENIVKPKETYLIGILIHRWETPWAKLFPLRLVLRLGAEYRYYPSPIISTRHRESVFVEIGHTIINLLADFRNFSYTLPQIRGLIIHMEDKNTTITIPANRYDQVIKSMNNSSDHILAFAGNFSQQADSHLVCIQDTQGNENCYSTHAINIHNKPRKVTGASFIVFNGALKSSSGLTAKSNIVEDGLMIQVLPEHMQQIRDNLRAMKDHTIHCGCVNAASDETVNIVWGENDVNFNVGVVSSIDNTPLSGVPSIRVHNAKNHVCANGSRLIRWTEVFIIQHGDDNPKNQDSVDVSRVSESIAKATCDALVKYLDLLVANNCQKIGIRTTLHVDNVSYLAGSNGSKLAPIYMKSLDDELIPVLHRITTNNLEEHSIVLELIFRILNS